MYGRSGGALCKNRIVREYKPPSREQLEGEKEEEEEGEGGGGIACMQILFRASHHHHDSLKFVLLPTDRPTDTQAHQLARGERGRVRARTGV